MIHGLKFFYELVLNRKMVAINLPDILSPGEVAHIIKSQLNLKHRTLLIVIYGAGLRASEAAGLSVKDIDT